MIHFPIHLENEVRLEGPHQNGWMYSTKEKWVQQIIHLEQTLSRSLHSRDTSGKNCMD